MERELSSGSARLAADVGGPDRGAAGGGGGPSDSGLLAGVGPGLFRLYYWATPLFLISDFVWGVSVRASFLPGAGPRLMYYGFCVLCAAAIQRWPVSAPWVGLGESAVNLLLLVLSIMLPIYGMQDAVLEGGAMPAPLTGARLINVLLSGTILIFAFHRSQRRIAVGGGRVGRILTAGDG